MHGTAEFYDYSGFGGTSMRVSAASCSVISEKRYTNNSYQVWCKGTINSNSSSSKIVFVGGDAGYYGTTYVVNAMMVTW